MGMKSAFFFFFLKSDTSVEQFAKKRSLYFSVGNAGAQVFYFLLHCSGFLDLCRLVENALYSLGRWMSAL